MSDNIEEITHYIFVWHTAGNPCPEQCAPLNGREWYDQDIFQDVLWDPIWGDLYDLNAGYPLTHGGTGRNCRCQLEVRVETDIHEIPEVDELSKFLGLV